MPLKLRRLTAATALVLSAIFAAAAFSAADARYTFQTDKGVEGMATRASVQIVADTQDCKRKPKWIQRWNNELNRFVWKQIWVEKCD